MNYSDHRTASRQALCGLLCEVPGSDDFLFWHIITTRGYWRPANTVMAVEPYSDGSTMRRLHHGIDHLTRTSGDETVRDDLCALLADLFDSTDSKLEAFLDRYLAEHGRADWRSAEAWLADLDEALRGLAEQDKELALRRAWVDAGTRSSRCLSGDEADLRTTQAS